jgi:ribosomal protein S18 acetylase RimI-like enzyme
VTRFRPFRNTDPPALVDIWNRSMPGRHVVCPLVVHDWDAMVAGKPHFDPAGLVVAERDGRVVGFAHAGFGPLEPDGPSHRLDTSLGTIAMFGVEPGIDDEVIDRGLVLEAERYLRRRGASVIYAGGRHPLDPFYWGLYGGSEFAGVLGEHTAFHRAVRRAGYQAASQAVLLEFVLGQGEPRDPRIALARRQTRLEVDEDHPAMGWWAATAIGPFRPTLFQVLSRSGSEVIASALTWEVGSELSLGGLNRTALIDVQVVPEYRRQGFGRLLVAEVLRHARKMMAERVDVQTLETNQAGLALYEGLGFRRVETATLYRLPGEMSARAD